MKAHNLAMPVYLMRLHDLLLTVVEHDGERYVPLRPVVDMLRLSWKRARARAMEAENMRLYDIQLLTPLPTNVFFAEGLEAVLTENEDVAPAESGQTGGVLPLERGKNAAIQEGNFTLKRVKTAAQEAGKKGDGGVYINIHRVYLYIARVSTSNVRAKSDDETADRILLLQQEWGKTLHDYEQYGIAVKGGQHKSLKELFAMRKHASEKERERLTYLITLALDAMGCPRRQRKNRRRKSRCSEGRTHEKHVLPPLPRKSTRADWLADIAAMIGAVAMLTAMGFFILTGEEPLPDAVKGEDHRAFVAELCPHLTKSARQDCRAWLTKGGRDE